MKDGVIILMDGNAMIALIKEKGLKGALEYVNQMRDLLLSDSKQQLHLILTNVQNIISESRKKRRVFHITIISYAGINPSLHKESLD